MTTLPHDDSQKVHSEKVATSTLFGSKKKGPRNRQLRIFVVSRARDAQAKMGPRRSACVSFTKVPLELTSWIAAKPQGVVPSKWA